MDVFLASLSPGGARLHGRPSLHPTVKQQPISCCPRLQSSALISRLTQPISNFVQCNGSLRKQFCSSHLV